MKKKIMLTFSLVFIFIAIVCCCACIGNSDDTGITPSAKTVEKKMITITDGTGREVTIPESPEYVICSGPGCLRYLTYLQQQDKIVGVDDMEKDLQQFEARPYAIANPWFRTDDKLGLIGEFRGHDNPELIVSLDPQPDIIFKTYAQSGYNPDELQEKTGIPVVTLEYGNLGIYRDDMYNSLRLMGKVMGADDRAEEVIGFFDENIADLNDRTSDISEEDKKTVYVGSIAHKGPHGFQSTEPGYPPFMFINAKNVGYSEEDGKVIPYADVAKEKIIEWDPELLFLDLSTLQSGDDMSGLYELRNDESYQTLSAVKKGDVYGVLPYNWYSTNHGNVLADAYYIGTVVYPDRFTDIQPDKKADEIYEFLVGAPVFEQMNSAFDNLAFIKLSV